MTKPRKRLTIAWLTSIVVIMALDRIDAFLSTFGRYLPLDFFSFLGYLVFCSISIYFIAVAVRFLLRKLFWRVGRRLLLSYLLIGLLPFLLFAILMTGIGYTAAGILSQSALRAQREATVSRMEQWNLEYALTGKRPEAGLKTLQIFDSRDGSIKKLPEWIWEKPFRGMVGKADAVFFVTSRVYDQRGIRAIAFVQPLDYEWVRSVRDEKNMLLIHTIARNNIKKKKGSEVHPDLDLSGSVDGENASGTGKNPDFQMLARHAWRNRGVIWGDISDPLVEWETGARNFNLRSFTFISNPVTNLMEAYIGRTKYAEVILGLIFGLTILLMLIYLFASLFAGVLIFSISRAVNRIERGTLAVERGDFSYRIGMKPRNQLGQMATSFDRMTESIGTLLSKVAEKERLQSEIDIAAAIQRNLLPKEGPKFRGVSFSAHFEPTASIGGDYYDVFNLDSSRLAVAIGDVSGHGLSTGLVMAMVKAAITTLVEEGANEATVFRRLNDLVFRSTEKRAFMTLAFTIFDLSENMIRHTNAGHLYPYILRLGAAPFALESPSLPLGVREVIDTRTCEVALEEGDTIVYLSDGIVEALDANGDPFGFDQLESLLRTVRGRSPAEVQETILSAIAVHSGTRPADDDRTVMVLRFDQLMKTADSPYAEEELADV